MIKLRKNSNDKNKIIPKKPQNQLLLVGLILFMGLIFVNFTSAVNWDNEAYYKLDETTGTVIDATGNGHNGTSSATAGVTGIINTAYNFTTNQFINLTNLNVSAIADEFSISLWVYKLDDNAERNVYFQGVDISGFGRLEIASNLTGHLNVQLPIGSESYVYSSVQLQNNSWINIILLHNSSVDNLYVNGTLVKSQASDPWIPTANYSIIGNNYASLATMPTNGLIDEVGVWNRVLSETEVSELYNSGAGLEFSRGGVSISLISPENGSIISSTESDFTAEFNTSGSNPFNYTWDNATFNIYYSNGTLFSSDFTGLTGNNTAATIAFSDLLTGDYLWNVTAGFSNSSFSNYSASETFEFQWRPFEITNQDYSPFVYETSYQRFTLNITTLPEILSVVTKLNYNGTEYSATTECDSGECDIYSDIDIPLVATGESLNYSFYWTVIVYDGASTYSFDTSDETNEQNVTRIHLEECGAYTTKTLNFTVYREDNLTQINPFKIAGTFQTWLGSGEVTRNSSFDKTSTSNLSLCVSPIDRTFYTDAQLEFSYSDENITYVPRDYHLQNASLTNISQEINLYLLEAEDSTTFIIKVQDQKLSGVVDALVYIQRYYPSIGEFKTVQIAKTDSNGETLGFYETETVDYRHLIIKDGTVLLQTSKQKVVGKEVPFTLTFTVGEGLGFPWAPWIKNPNIYSSLTLNKTTNVVSFIYIDTTGLTDSARLFVFKESNTNSTQTIICNTTSTQSAATITCNMTGYDGSFIAYGYIGEENVDVLSFIITSSRDIFGREGLLLGVFIIMVAGFAFIWNPVAGIICINATVILVNMIGFISVSPVFIFAMICVSFIAGILLKS